MLRDFSKQVKPSTVPSLAPLISLLDDLILKVKALLKGDGVFGLGETTLQDYMVCKNPLFQTIHKLLHFSAVKLPLDF
jgi:hypothetical protein